MKFGNMGLGVWAFIIGLLLVLLSVLSPATLGLEMTAAFIAIAAFVVAYFNVGAGESTKMIWVGILFAVVGLAAVFGNLTPILGGLSGVVQGIGSFLLWIALWTGVIVGFNIARK